MGVFSFKRTVTHSFPWVSQIQTRTLGFQLGLRICSACKCMDVSVYVTFCEFIKIRHLEEKIRVQKDVLRFFSHLQTIPTAGLQRSVKQANLSCQFLENRKAVVFSNLLKLCLIELLKLVCISLDCMRQKLPGISI